MQESLFLSGYSQDPDLRLQLWDLFEKAEEEARKFAADEDDWYEIVEVKCLPYGRNPYWRWDDSRGQARIGIVPRGEDLGAIFHEIFHSAFHNSLLHGKIGSAKERYDEDWGDPFSEAFRYFMEKLLLNYVPSNWFDEMEKICQMDFQQGLAEYGQDQALYKKYRYPGSLIIRKANRDYGEFKDLWSHLLSSKCSQMGCPMLNEFFSYDIQVGQPISKNAHKL